MAIDYNQLNEILNKIQKIKVDQLGELNQRIEDFSKYRKEQDQKMQKILIDCDNWKNNTKKENESVLKNHINESKDIINDIKQNMTNLKGENTKWKKSLVEEQGLIFQWYLEKINQHIKENKKRGKELSDEINNKLNEINKYIDKYITSLDKKIENQSKELKVLENKIKTHHIIIYYIAWPIILLIIWFLIYIKFIF